MKRGRFVFAAALSFCALVMGIIFVHAGEAFAVAGEYKEGEAIVLLKHDDFSRGAAAAMDTDGRVRSYAAGVAGRANASLVRTYNALSSSESGVFAYVTSKKERTEELIERLMRDPNVISASPNYVFRAFEKRPDDMLYYPGKNHPGLWGMERINAPKAWDITTGDGTGAQYVAVLDSGIAQNHEDLRENYAERYSAGFTDEGVEDGGGHGTHVSGTIGAVGNNGMGVAGVNWKTKIIAVKVLDNESGENVGDSIVAGLDHVKGLIDQGVDVAAVNMSLGGWAPITPQEVVSERDPYYEAFKTLAEHTVIVVASGNEGSEVGAPYPRDDFAGEEGLPQKGEYVYPASFIDIPNKIVVGAIGINDKSAPFTNWSDKYVDVLAPGLDILSTYVSEVGYDFNSGTSMAAPHVAGAVALLKSYYRDWKPSDLKNVIIAAANGNVNPSTIDPHEQIPEMVPPTGKISANGLLDVGKAVELLNLTGLHINDVQIEDFDPWTAGYTFSVDESVTGVRITPTALHPSLVSATVNGRSVSSPVSISAGGRTEIAVDVTLRGTDPPNVTKKTYHLVVLGGTPPSPTPSPQRSGSSSGCDATGFAAMAVLLLLGLAKVRERRG